MSDVQGAKAISLVIDGKVSEIPHARVFTVPSSDGKRLYTVVLYARPIGAALTEAGRDVCTCEAGLHGRRCYHVRAAHLLLAREREAVQRPVDVINGATS